jgi:4-hydroxy-tetrahydrodipicolinate reductase
VKLAVIGNGKTGGFVEALASKRHEITVFNLENPATPEKLHAYDAAIVFVPADGFTDLASVLIASGIPAVIGTTGFSFDKISGLKAPWIVASNFSLGMNFMFLLTRTLPSLRKSSPAASFAIHEVHHVHKKDSPSGTALSLKALLPADTALTAEREGDVPGLHTVTVSLPGETLKVEHEAQDRTVFATGALYAAESLLRGLSPAVHRFETIFADQLKKEFSHA